MAGETKYTCDLCGRRFDESLHGFGVQWRYDERAGSGDRIEMLGNLRDANKHVCAKCVDDLIWEAERYKGHSAMTYFAARVS